MRKKIGFITSFLFIVSIFSCLDSTDNKNGNVMKTVDYVDIERFMGDWYVIANIPTFIEKEATNAIESYRLDKDGNIATTFTFFKKSSPKKAVATSTKPTNLPPHHIYITVCKIRVKYYYLYR